MIDGSVIAVIDDDESVRAALASLLRSTGLAVNLFHGAEEFQRSPWRPDAACLIVDVRMPGVSGLNLQELLVARGHLLPIIFISAHADAGERDRALAAGALGISKPFAADELFQYIDCALKQDKLLGN